jgi:hypothetical protein
MVMCCSVDYYSPLLLCCVYMTIRRRRRVFAHDDDDDVSRIAQQWLNGDHHGNNFNQAELSSSTDPTFSIRRVYIVA